MELFCKMENEGKTFFTPPSTLDPDPDPEERRAGEHTEKRSAGRAGEHKGRERGQATPPPTLEEYKGRERGQALATKKL
jgi:hypothetical protein